MEKGRKGKFSSLEKCKPMKGRTGTPTQASPANSLYPTLQPIFWPIKPPEGLTSAGHCLLWGSIPTYFTPVLRKPSPIQILFPQGFTHPED